jgi:hypothetical protein
MTYGKENVAAPMQNPFTENLKHMQNGETGKSNKLGLERYQQWIREEKKRLIDTL